MKYTFGTVKSSKESLIVGHNVNEHTSSAIIQGISSMTTKHVVALQECNEKAQNIYSKLNGVLTNVAQNNTDPQTTAFLQDLGSLLKESYITYEQIIALNSTYIERCSKGIKILQKKTQKTAMLSDSYEDGDFDELAQVGQNEGVSISTEPSSSAVNGTNVPMLNIRVNDSKQNVGFIY